MSVASALGIGVHRKLRNAVVIARMACMLKKQEHFSVTLLVLCMDALILRRQEPKSMMSAFISTQSTRFAHRACPFLGAPRQAYVITRMVWQLIAPCINCTSHVLVGRILK